jgi:hypothetical protein
MAGMGFPEEQARAALANLANDALGFPEEQARAALANYLLNGVGGQRGGAYPAGGVCWRGGGFDMAHQGFFTAGKKYRVPGFLATSLRQEATDGFMYCAEEAGFDAAQWRILLDPRGENLHVSELSVPHCPGEQEFLFQAFSVFTVKEVQWSASATAKQPHRITLVPALDNALEPEDLPLAPWF